MGKLSNLLLSSLAILILLGISNWVANNSKSSIKSSLNLCNLEVGEQGWVKGQVTEVNKTEWYKRRSTIGEGTQGCRVTIISRPEDILLQKVGAKVRVLIKVDSEGFASVINNQVHEDLSVIGIDGKITPVEVTSHKMNKKLLSTLTNWDTARLYIPGENRTYEFTKDILKDMKPSKLYKWYYQENLAGVRIITRVELVE